MEDRGESERRTSCIIANTTPNSLCTPVPTTTPSPLPLLTSVPINATLLLSAIGSPPTPCPPSVIASVCFFAGFVSPVKADSSISRPWDCVRRMSAGIRSPVWKVMRSPGTRTFARTVVFWPFLRKKQRKVSRERWQEGRRGDAPDEVAVVRDELVERFERLLGPLFLDEADCRRGKCQRALVG